MTIVTYSSTPITKAKLEDLIMFSKKWDKEKWKEFLVDYHKQIMSRLKGYLCMKLKNKNILRKIDDIFSYLKELEYYKKHSSDVVYGDIFISTNFEGKKEVHFVRNLIEDSEWKLVIAENWKDFWYLGEKDKQFFIW